MPLIKTTFFSNQLLEDVDMNIYIPDAYQENYNDLDVMLLCHGMGGSENAWIKLGNIIRTADEFKTIMIMPRLNNSFGIDMASGYNAEKYLIEEAYEYAHKWLNLNRKKEKNIIAGLSMGGFIALNIGIKYQNLFSHIIALSAPMSIDYVTNNFPTTETVNRIIQNAFGKDIKQEPDIAIIKQASTKTIKSKIDLYCGKNDEFYQKNYETYQILKSRNIDVTFLEDEGNHTWYYWEKYLKEFLSKRNK